MLCAVTAYMQHTQHDVAATKAKPLHTQNPSVWQTLKQLPIGFITTK
jgi:hypothetical protein